MSATDGRKRNAKRQGGESGNLMILAWCASNALTPSGSGLHYKVYSNGSCCLGNMGNGVTQVSIAK